MKVLVTGCAGQVGEALMRSVPPHVRARGLTHEQLDICDQTAVRKMVADFKPEVIVNAAAYTAVDRAESEPAMATAVNAEAPSYLAEAAEMLRGCRLVHISTDYVFDGESRRPYRTEDRPNPINVYGHTKLEGEKAVISILQDRAVILRTAWLYAAEGHNFLSTMLRLMRDRGAVRVVCDQWGAPTAATSVAHAIWRICDVDGLSGPLHWTDDGLTTWYEFACAIAEYGTDLGLLASVPRVDPIATAEYPTAAKRPSYSALDLSRSVDSLCLRPIGWRESLRATLAAKQR